jgi:ribose transport system permease protein
VITDRLAGAAPQRELAQRLGVTWAPRESLTLLASFVAVFAVFAITLSDLGFLSSFNLLNILYQAVPIAVMAIAMVFVLSAGEIDLSVGSVVALSALVTGVVLRDAPLAVGVLAGLGTGVAVGLANGLLVTKLGMPSFLVTLAALELVGGLARTITDLEAVAIQNDAFTSAFGSGSVGGVEVQIVWLAAATGIGYLVYRHRAFGAHVRATGDNRQAAETSGIPTDRVRIKVMVLAGAAAALAGLLQAGRLEGAQYTLGENDLLTVIAAVIVGGTSLFGGRGSIVGAVVGAVLLSMLDNGLILYGFSVSEQKIALGIVIILAVAAGLRTEKRS